MEVRRLDPGDQLGITNTQSASISLTLTMAYGARVRATLIPGGRIEVDVGNRGIVIDIHEGDPAGVQLITPTVTPSS